MDDFGPAEAWRELNKAADEAATQGLKKAERRYGGASPEYVLSMMAWSRRQLRRAYLASLNSQ